MSRRALWAIVLAGGDGSRLAETSRRMYGSCLPKQFLSFGRRRTFLQATIDRLGTLVPGERTVVVVAARHEALAREQLADVPGVELVAQPSNLGTGPGVLLPLIHVLRRDPGADVALVPSDHDFRAPEAMLRALHRARQAARQHQGMVLLGAVAESPASDLGWIVPKRKLSPQLGVGSIRQFVEKPAPALATRLFQAGALWNTMLSATPGEVLWSLARRRLPLQAALFESYAPEVGTRVARETLRALYERLPAADFSRDLVAGADRLWVTPMLDSGWSDCGTPERLEAVMGEALRAVEAGAALRVEPAASSTS